MTNFRCEISARLRRDRTRFEQLSGPAPLRAVVVHPGVGTLATQSSPDSLLYSAKASRTGRETHRVSNLQRVCPFHHLGQREIRRSKTALLERIYEQPAATPVLRPSISSRV